MLVKKLIVLAHTVTAVSVHTNSKALPVKGVFPPEAEDHGRHDAADKFIPKCVSHLKQLTATLDHNYTDLQVEDTLANECSIASEMPIVFSDGFKTADACRHFAREVNKARMEFLEQHSEHGYGIVCSNYWTHMHAKTVEVASPVAAPVGLTWRTALCILAIGTLIAVATNRSIEKSVM